MWIITRCCKKAVQKYIFFLKYQRVIFLKVNINLNFALQFVLPGFFDCFPFIFFISFDVQAGDISFASLHSMKLTASSSPAINF